MKKNNGNENKLCFILHSISASLFTVSGILNLVNKGFNDWFGYSGIALGVTFGSLAFIYYKKFKEENK